MTEKVLAGRTAFVSGSGRNIGRGIAVRLAEMGANVVVNGSNDEAVCRETATLVEAQGVQALVAMGDMSRAEDIARIAEAALGRFGTVDILVNNAARRPHKPFLDGPVGRYRGDGGFPRLARGAVRDRPDDRG